MRIDPPRNRMHVAPRTVIAYHGCRLDVAKHILDERRFIPSTKSYDWLGEGVYFWEYAPHRAMNWARSRCSREGGTPAMIEATIRLGRCLNLPDVERMTNLSQTHRVFVDTIGDERLARNSDTGAHHLDRAIVDAYCRNVALETTRPVQTVRGSFPEGEPVYPGSKILSKAHTDRKSTRLNSSHS